MIATLGHISILLALFAALCGIVSPILAARWGQARYLDFARYAIFGQFVLVTLAAASLIYGLIATDFSIKYVAFNTTRATPIYYRVTGLWGALEGLSFTVGVDTDHFLRSYRMDLSRTPQRNPALGDHDFFHRLDIFFGRPRFSLQSF